MPDPNDVAIPQPVVAESAPTPAPAAPEPAAEVSPTAAASPAAVVEPVSAAAAEATPTAEKPADAHSEPTLLEKFDAEKKPEAKPDEKPANPEKPAEADKEDPAKPAETPPELPKVDYKYELPESITMDDAQKGEFTTALDKFRTDPTTGAQGLIDLHNKTMQVYADHLSQEQHRVWNDTRAKWRTEVMADPEIGGSGHQTALGAIARMRDLFVPAKDKPAFEEFLRVTGAGDHPAFLRAMHQAARYFDEPSLPPPGAKPTPSNGKAPGKAVIYDHPSSQRKL